MPPDASIALSKDFLFSRFCEAVLEKSENISEISNQISIACGKEMHIKYIDTKPQQEEMSEEQELSNFANGFNIPFDVIE